MTELKTLKDMEFVDCMIGHPSDEVFRDILKQEAIKHIKSGNMVEGAKLWAIKFFNITEEDLK